VWLVAEVRETSPPAVVFSAKPPDTWGDVKRERVLTHFRTFRLGALYTSHAAEELQSMQYSLTQCANRGRSEGVRAHLMEQAKSHQFVTKNSWKFAMYKALGKSEWFCQGGYMDILASGATA